jgi:hypothetical protein
MESLDQWLQEQHTDINIRQIIMQGVQSIRSSQIPTTRRENLFTPCHLQNEMGWYVMFTGCAAHGWDEQQQHHYNAMGKRKTGKRWLIALLKKLLEISWDQWAIRNGIVHATESSRLSTQCNKFITECFLLHPTTWDKDTLLLVHRKHTLLRKHVTSRYAWCVRIQAWLTYSKITTPSFQP